MRPRIRLTRRFSLIAAFVGCMLGGVLAQAQGEVRSVPPASAVVAVLTLPHGEVTRWANGQLSGVEPFTPLAQGDQLNLPPGTRLTLLYPQSGRIEVWQGPGQLRIGAQGGQGSGLVPLSIGQMPVSAAQQIARTPRDGLPLAFAPRTRALVVEAPTNVEETYQRMRRSAPADDLNPEMYLLSALFERRDFARLEQVLAELKARQPGNPEVGMLVALYGKALRNAQRP